MTKVIKVEMKTRRLTKINKMLQIQQNIKTTRYWSGFYVLFEVATFMCYK